VQVHVGINVVDAERLSMRSGTGKRSAYFHARGRCFNKLRMMELLAVAAVYDRRISAQRFKTGKNATVIDRRYS
jgi:hypothetical protein